MDRGRSDSQSGTAYFMKPMPRKRGSSMGDPPAARAPDVATQLWRKLSVEGDENDSSELAEPVRLEHFDVQRIIGRGGMGAVYLARDTRLNRDVALKVLAPEHTSSQSSMDRFRNEARAAARLDHDNIARVHYLGGQFSHEPTSALSGPALPFIAFEFVEGTNVRQLIRKRGAFSTDDAIRAAFQLGHALRHTHACGVVHRDIKPSNVIITPSGRVKLVDLGLARTEDPDASRDLTVAGTTLGTFDYISPEQAKDPRIADIRSDIYSLGCTLYHMVVGKPPYPEGTMLQKLLDHQDRIVPDAHAMNKAVPVEFSDLIRRMMDSQPSERPQTPDELLFELSRVSGELGVQSSGREGLVWVKDRSRRSGQGWREHLGWVIAGSILLLIAIFVDQVGHPSPTSSPQAAAEPSTAGADSSDSESASVDDLAIAIEDDPPKPVVDVGTVPKPSTPIKSVTTAEPRDELPLGKELASETDATASDSPAAKKRGMADLKPITAPLTLDTPTLEIVQPYAIVQNGVTTTYATLTEAIKDASDGARIEVREGGLIASESPFVRVSGKEVTIAPADDLTQRPKLQIVRPRSTSVTAVKLFQLQDGATLRLYDIDVEIVVEGTATQAPWHIFSLEQYTELDLGNISLTVKNPTGVDVSIVRAATDKSDATDLAFFPATIPVEDCLIRGEAAFIDSDGICPIAASIDKSAFALSEPFLRVSPPEMPMVDGVDSSINIHFDRSTWAGLSHFLSVKSDKEIAVADVQLSSISNSVFASLNREVPLIAIEGPWYEDDLAPLVSWHSSNKFNYHSGEIAWQISSTEGVGAPITFDELTARSSESQTEQSVDRAIVGELRYPESAITAFGETEFKPVDDPGNPIVRGASGGRTSAGVPTDGRTLPKPVGE